MSEGFALLWSSILRSSLWVSESKETRLVWITLLALRDSEGIVRSSVIGLADSAKVSVDECRAALKVLLSPDPEDTSKVDEGRRIREAHGGWQIVNHDKYRFSSAAKREFWRQQKAEQRSKPKPETSPETQQTPVGFPATIEEATVHAEFINCPKSFAEKVWNKASGRGGCDSRGVEIRSFRHQLQTEWAYEQERQSKLKTRNRGPNI